MSAIIAQMTGLLTPTHSSCRAALSCVQPADAGFVKSRGFPGSSGRRRASPVVGLAAWLPVGKRWWAYGEQMQQGHQRPSVPYFPGDNQVTD
jgi:hypothetical protein